MRTQNYHKIVYVTVILLATLTNGAYAAGSFSVMYGDKMLDKNDWEPLDLHTEKGFGIEAYNPKIPVSAVVSYLSSEDSATIIFSGAKVNTSVKTSEIGLGVRGYLIQDRVRIFMEGGTTVISVDGKARWRASGSDQLFSVSDSAIGLWGGAGMAIMVSDAFSFGVLGRISEAIVNLDQIGDINIGGRHLNFFIAYHFNGKE